MNKGYYISKEKASKEIVYLDYSQIIGYNIKPKNSDKYGFEINKLIIVKPSLVEKMLVKKTQHKLELFLKRMVYLLDSDEDDGDAYREALNDMTRYKNIINYKYRKYLTEKYVDKLNKKIHILEQELKKRILYLDNNNLIREQMYQTYYDNIYGYDDTKVTHRTK